MMMLRLAAGAALLLLSSASGAASPPAPLADVGVVQKLAQAVPLQLSLVDEEGHARPLAAYLAARPTLLIPAYYRCPMLCSHMLGELAGALNGLSLDAGADYEVVVVSFDPRDTPDDAAARKAAVVRRYHRPTGAAGWHFLTGTQSAITQLMQAVGYRYTYDPQSEQYAHPAALLVLTPGGHIARYFVGLDLLPRELRRSLVEAADGKIGSPIERLLLFCYKYDPAHGRYGVAVLRAVQVGGGLTIVGLLVLISALLARERRSPWR